MTYETQKILDLGVEYQITIDHLFDEIHEADGCYASLLVEAKALRDALEKIGKGDLCGLRMTHESYTHARISAYGAIERFDKFMEKQK